MANNPYVNKVIYGNDTIIDLTGDTVTPADVASGKTFHDASGEAQTGSYVAPTITDITPSNSDPVTLTEGNNYAITGNGGKAIERLLSTRVSSNSWVTIPTNSIVRNIGENTAVMCEPIDITPSNSSPPTMWGNGFYRTTALKGYLIESYSDIAPSNSNPATITSGSIYKATANGKAVENITNVTPSNSSPVPLTSGDIDKIGGNGYAIESYTSKTPDDTNPPSVSNGDIVKAGGSGYLYASQQTTTPVTPSDSNPPLLTANTKYTPTANGYLHETQRVGPTYTKTGTLPDFTASNQEQTVDTGLSEIKYFYVEGYPKNYKSTMLSCAWLDTTKSFAKQVATNSNSAGTSSAVNSGTNASGVITSAGVHIKVSGISGGTVTIKTGNSVNYAHEDVKWYAG